MTMPPVVIAHASTFDWKSLIDVLELAGNLATGILVPGGAAFVPLLTGLENAVNPLLQNIGTGQSVQAQTMTIYGTIIGILTTLKQTPGLPAETLTKVDDYVIMTQNGTAEYLQNNLGYNPADYAPTTPIA